MKTYYIQLPKLKQTSFSGYSFEQKQINKLNRLLTECNKRERQLELDLRLQYPTYSHLDLKGLLNINYKNILSSSKAANLGLYDSYDVYNKIVNNPKNLNKVYNMATDLMTTVNGLAGSNNLINKLTHSSAQNAIADGKGNLLQPRFIIGNIEELISTINREIQNSQTHRTINSNFQPFHCQVLYDIVQENIGPYLPMIKKFEVKTGVTGDADNSDFHLGTFSSLEFFYNRAAKKNNLTDLTKKVTSKLRQAVTKNAWNLTRITDRDKERQQIARIYSEAAVEYLEWRLTQNHTDPLIFTNVSGKILLGSEIVKGIRDQDKMHLSVYNVKDDIHRQTKEEEKQIYDELVHWWYTVMQTGNIGEVVPGLPGVIEWMVNHLPADYNTVILTPSKTSIGYGSFY